MQGSHELHRIIQEIGRLNEQFFPAQIVGAALVVALAAFCLARPGRISSSLMKGLQAVLHGLIAYGMVVCLFNIGGFYYAFVALLECAVTALFAADIFCNTMQFSLPGRKDLRIMSLVLIIYGIVLYPAAELLMGYTWPAIAVFGALCPTSIVSIGVVMTAAPGAKRDRLLLWLLGLLSLGALVCGGRAVLMGGYFDISYLLSGVCGVYFLARYRRSAG
ncbi:MAG: hypothetical protein JXA20_15625 [Spirochaetes bacterium]|nr:hypothetical protein [Spirochaetota bacterium]